MLVLSRKLNEKIILILPDGRKVSIRNLTPANVRLGIEGPKEVVILREEVKKQKDAGSE